MVTSPEAVEIADISSIIEPSLPALLVSVTASEGSMVGVSARLERLAVP